MSFRIGNKGSKNKKYTSETKIEYFDTDIDGTLALFYQVCQKRIIEDDNIILNNLEEFIQNIPPEQNKILITSSQIKFGFLNIKIESDEQLFFHKNLKIEKLIEVDFLSHILPSFGGIKSYKNLFLKIKPIGADIKIKSINYFSTIP